MLTIPQIIQIGDVTVYLAANDNAKGNLFGQRIASPVSPVLVEQVTDALRWRYDGNPTDTTLRGTANYLFWLCGLYNLQAQAIIGGSGGGTVIPITPGTGSGIFPIYITQDNFDDATNYNDTRIVGQNLIIFMNEINRYLIPGVDFAYTVTGINILIPGFDATTIDYNLVIEKFTVGQSTGGGGSLTASWYYGGTDYTSDLAAGIDSVSYGGNFSTTVGGNLAYTFPDAADDEPVYLIFRVPDTQEIKDTWFYDSFNNGGIPDSVWAYNAFGGYRYYYTRNPFAFTVGSLTITLSTA